MAVDQETKDYITTHFDSFTAKELAEKFKISKSTVTRIIKTARDDAAKMKEESKQDGAGAGAEEKKDSTENHPNDDFEWKPDTEERETIELETDDGLHKLLKSAPQNDLDEEADTHGKELTMAAEEEKAEEEPDKGQVHEVMQQLTEPDDEEINSLLSGLLGPGDYVPQPKSQPKPKPARSAKKAPTRAVAVHASESPTMAAVPSSALVAQIRLYVQHFGP
jgi:transposase